MIPIVGGPPTIERLVRKAIDFYPSWYVRGARIAKVIITNREDVKNQIAMYEHGSRNLYVWTGVGGMLQKAMGHELAHANDDAFGYLHFFTNTSEWLQIHREATHFDIPKYRDEPLEYFADCVTKIFLLGAQKFGTTCPKEAMFITSFFFPTLQQAYGQEKS